MVELNLAHGVGRRDAQALVFHALLHEPVPVLLKVAIIVLRTAILFTFDVALLGLLIEGRPVLVNLSFHLKLLQ